MTEMVKRKDKVAEFRGILENPKLLRQLTLAAPQHLRADRIARIAMTSLQNQPKLLECTWQSVVGCIMTCTQLGLELEATQGQAYMVPYKKTATLIVGYRGMMTLALRTGAIVSIEARVVREGDVFEYTDEPPSLRHVRDLDGDPGAAMKYVYAVAVHNNTTQYRQYEVLSAKQIASIKARSQARNDGPWVTDPAEMWRKSAVRRLCKYLTQSPELSSAITLDEQADVGLPQAIVQVDENILDEVDGEPEHPIVDAKPAEPSKPAERVGAGLYQKVHEAAMALPTETRKIALETFGCKLATDAKALDSATANDLLVALTDAKGG